MSGRPERVATWSRRSHSDRALETCCWTDGAERDDTAVCRLGVRVGAFPDSTGSGLVALRASRRSPFSSGTSGGGSGIASIEPTQGAPQAPRPEPVVGISRHPAIPRGSGHCADCLSDGVGSGERVARRIGRPRGDGCVLGGCGVSERQGMKRAGPVASGGQLRFRALWTGEAR